MRLLEYQAKRIFAEYGIPIPKASVINRSEPINGLEVPAVLKAQVLSGGRGKAGAIRIAHQVDEVELILTDLWAMNVKGQRVAAVLAEELVEIHSERYLAVLVDKKANQLVVIGCSEGGVDIEEVARSHPEKIFKKHLDLSIGLPDYIARALAQALQVTDWVGLKNILKKMVDIFIEQDATLVEINPLVETTQGLVALDAKMVLDDKASYRHAELFDKLSLEQAPLSRAFESEAECLAAERGITYVPLGGDVGLISDGAGTGMLTIDLIHDFGGRPANFCELGGLGDAERMRQALEVILAEPKVKSLLIVLIGGLTRMDDMAEGIAAYLKDHQASVPFSIRMCGTQEEAGKAILAGIGLSTFDDLTQAVQQAVQDARRQ